jgi:hypothetical protein
VLPRAFRTTLEILGASGGDLGLQDGRRRMVRVVGWLRWKPGQIDTLIKKKFLELSPVHGVPVL